MWTSFRIDGRDMEWCVEPGPPQVLLVRSLVGDYLVRAQLSDGAWGYRDGKPYAYWVMNPVVLGSEFLLGRYNEHTPIQLHGVEFARHAIVHTELVRSLIGRWTHRRRYLGRPKP